MTPAETGSIDGDGDGDDLSHVAFPYRDTAEYLDHVLPFVQGGLACSEPVLVAVPAEQAGRIRAALPAGDGQAAFPDMDQIGRNPARVTSALNAFASQHVGQRIRCITELMWPGRTSAEAAEVIKHEALVNLALATAPAQILCPYDASRLSSALIAQAAHTHPAILAQGDQRASPGYQLPSGAGLQAELTAPPASAQSLAYSSQLRSVRALVGRYADRAGLPPERSRDLVLAVGEITGNTLRHTNQGGTVHIWTSGGHVFCQVHDEGWITDPLVGRRWRPPQDLHGQGLWLVNQMCDLVEMRTGPAGTTFRLRMRLPAG